MPGPACLSRKVFATTLPRVMAYHGVSSLRTLYAPGPRVREPRELNYLRGWRRNFAKNNHRSSLYAGQLTRNGRILLWIITVPRRYPEHILLLGTYRVVNVLFANCRFQTRNDGPAERKVNFQRNGNFNSTLVIQRTMYGWFRIAIHGGELNTLNILQISRGGCGSAVILCWFEHDRRGYVTCSISEGHQQKPIRFT